VITDGIVDIADPNLLQSLLGHLRQTNVSCSFVQLVDHIVCDCGLGQVPYPEMLQFLACATYGAYFARIPHVVSVGGCDRISIILRPEMCDNTAQKSLFVKQSIECLFFF
jgi:hypothetical protein